MTKMKTENDFANIPVVILAGGFGTRLREQTEFIPKPMVPVGNKPLLWHIMKIYSHYGFRRFIICLGYKSEVIKDYFIHYKFRNSDFTINLGEHDRIDVHDVHTESNWQATLAETGLDSMTGARVKCIEKYIDTDYFMLTYGDGLADIDIKKLVVFHNSHGKSATITGVSPLSRFGEIVAEGDNVIKFTEKPQSQQRLINGGFFVFNMDVFNYLKQDKSCVLEKGPLEDLAKDGKLTVYHHTGFWQCVDTPRDYDLLNRLWKEPNPPWKVWSD